MVCPPPSLIDDAGKVLFILVSNKTKVVLHCINSLRQLRDRGVIAARQALI